MKTVIHWDTIERALDAAIRCRDIQESTRLMLKADTNIAECNTLYRELGDLSARRKAYGWAVVREAADLANLIVKEDRKTWATGMRERFRTIRG